MNTRRTTPAPASWSGTNARTTRNHAGPLAGICLYPNLLAEYKESRYDIVTLCEYARLTKDKMTAVMTRGEDLPVSSMLHLSHLFGVKYSYLASNDLTTFTPTTPTGQRKIDELAELMKEVFPDRSLYADHYHNGIFKRAVKYMTDIQGDPDRPRTYAGWRWTRDGILAVIDFQGRAKRRREATRRKYQKRPARQI